MNTVLVDVVVLYNLKDLDRGTPGDIVAVCTSTPVVEKITIDRKKYVVDEERKAVVCEDGKLLLLADEYGPYVSNIDLDKAQEQLKEQALAKLTPEEQKALGLVD